MRWQNLVQQFEFGEIVFLYDSPGSIQGYGQLRCIPALQQLGVQDFTYPVSWHRVGSDMIPLTDYDFRHLEEIDTCKDHLGVITNQGTEQDTTHSIQKIINTYRRREATLVVVADVSDFTSQDDHRPLWQNQYVQKVGPYSRVYSAFESRYKDAGFEFPLTDTKNLFLQDNAILYEIVTGNSVSTTSELFEVLPENPYLPLYSPFIDIFDDESGMGSAPLDSDSERTDLAKWLCHYIEWELEEAKDVAYELNNYVAGEVSAFRQSQRYQHKSIADVRRTLQDLDPDESEIHKHFVTWLREVKQHG